MIMSDIETKVPESLTVVDVVYGEQVISEPVLVELATSPTIERLKGVCQQGYWEPFFPGTSYSRFEHSVGVSLLLKRFAAPVEEQAAGLIHDASHSVFSHCIDYVLPEGSPTKHSHQDNIFAEYVRGTEIPGILARHGFEPERVLDEHNFAMLETSLPDLCADRIDYTLRNGTIYKVILPEQAEAIVASLMIIDGKWVFRDYDSAIEFAELFSRLNSEYYTDPASASMYSTVGDAIRHALGQGYITEADLYTTDAKIIAKLVEHSEHDPELAKLWRRMNQMQAANQYPHFVHDATVEIKSRVVDPLCWDDGERRRLSDLDEAWAGIVKSESRPKRYYLTYAD